MGFSDTITRGRGEPIGINVAGIVGGIFGWRRVIIGEVAVCIGGNGGGAMIWRRNVGVRFSSHDDGLSLGEPFFVFGFFNEDVFNCLI